MNALSYRDYDSWSICFHICSVFLRFSLDSFTWFAVRSTRCMVKAMAVQRERTVSGSEH